MRMLQPRVRPAKQGIALLIKRADPFYLSDQWKETRARVLERDGHRCTILAATAERSSATTSSAARPVAPMTTQTFVRSAASMTMPVKKTISASEEATPSLIGDGAL